MQLNHIQDMYRVDPSPILQKWCDFINLDVMNKDVYFDNQKYILGLEVHYVKYINIRLFK